MASVGRPQVSVCIRQPSRARLGGRYTLAQKQVWNHILSNAILLKVHMLTPRLIMYILNLFFPCKISIINRNGFC